MPLFENLRIERSHGPTVLSLKPVVRLTGKLRDSAGFARAWPQAVPALREILAAIGVTDQPGSSEQLAATLAALFAPLPAEIEEGDAVEHAGRLLAAVAAGLKAGARAPAGAWGALTPNPPRFLAYWDDWMDGVGRAAARGSAELCEAALADPNAKLEDVAKTALLAVREARVDGFIYSMILVAEARGIPWRTLSRGDLFVVFGQGRRQHWIRGSLADTQSYASVMITMRKDLASKILAQAGFPVPEHRLVKSRKDAARAAEALGFPLVVKPFSGSRAQNVSLWLESVDSVVAAYDRCGPEGTMALVELQALGEPYRITVFSGRAVAVSRHAVPAVVGDGKATLRELIDALDARAVTPVPDDYAVFYPFAWEFYREHLARRLKEQNLTLESVPEHGREVLLGYIPKQTGGGLYPDITGRTHPGLMRMAEDAALLIGTPTLGLDLITTDISAPPGAVPLAINEVNSSPGYRGHEQAERPRPTGRYPLDSAFPAGDQGRIPLAVFFAPQGSAALDFLERLLTAAGWTPGVADPDAARIAGYALRPSSGRSAHPGAAVLRDRRADAGVFALDEGDLTRRGIPSEHADVVAFPSGTSTRAQHSLRQGMSCLAALPGRLLLAAPGEMPEWLRKAAAQRRWIAVTAPENGMQPPPEGGEILCCETGPQGELRALLCGQDGRDLLCDRLDEDRAAAQLWALAALLGFGFAPGEIRRLALRCRPADPGSKPAGTVSAGVFETQGARRA